MPQPKKKSSRHAKGIRRSHHRANINKPVKCPNCDAMKLPHSVCPYCGQYKGVQVIEPKTNY